MRLHALAVICLLALCLPIGATSTIQPQQLQRPQQADGVVTLLADLENVLAGNQVEGFPLLTAASMSSGEIAIFTATSFAPEQNFAVVRERDRRPTGPGYLVMVEMLLGRGKNGRIATWQLLVQPRPPQAAEGAVSYEIASATPIAAVDGLVQLDLDISQQYEVRDLTFTAPGLTVRLSSGVVFLGRVDEGPTALVFRGRGEMVFAPADPAEQVQIRAFGGRPSIDTPIESLFLRLSPYEFQSRVDLAQLVPTTPHPGDIARAQQIFEEFGRRSYTLNLGDLTTARWSLLPPPGDTLAELRTRRHGNLTYVRSVDDAEDVSLFDRQRGRNISVYASPERLLTRGPYYSEDDAIAYDVEHYAIDVTLDPERDWISGRGTLRLRTKVDGLSTLSLKLAESLAVSSISSPELGRVLALRVSGQSGVLVSLPQALPRGSRLVLDVFYSGRLAPQAVDREAIDVEGQVAQGPPNPLGMQDIVIPPEPRYLYSNRTYWYPQATVTDFATAALQITLPAQFQVVASGNLINSTVSQVPDPTGRTGDSRAMRTVQFLADRPLRYVAALVSRFVPVGTRSAPAPAVARSALVGADTEVEGALPSDAVAVDVVATPRLLRSNRSLPERVADIVSFYSGVIGEAPYPNFTLATLDAELPSGHSPAYFALWNQPTLPTTLSWRDDPVALHGHPFFFLAHEVAHQWWGQAVGWKNYHEQWLSEGLAQYFAAMYAAHDGGEDLERRLFAQMRSSAMDLSRHGPVHLGYRLGHIQNDSRIFRGLVYNKSAVVLHMLRRLIGPDAFMRGIQRFYRTHRFQKAGTGDLQAAFEAETTLSLDRFFERWILGFSLPEARLSWRMDPAGTHVVIRVEQTGDVFDFPLTVTLQFVAGAPEQVHLVVSNAVQEVRVPVSARVRQVDTRDDLSLVNVRR
ncbi:MAG: M1 family aminopeptidase [Acidobacteria bacterium]|nr:M1 family aminopeptidase [Acidobacteriota bacterium]